MTIVIGVKAEFVVRSVNPEGVRVLPAPEHLAADAEQVMTALLELEESGCGVSDAAVAADLAKGEIEISVVAEAATYEDAEARATSCLRAAIHKAGGATPGWTVDFQVQNKQSELVTA